jgi:hypothetical protein
VGQINQAIRPSKGKSKMMTTHPTLAPVGCTLCITLMMAHTSVIDQQQKTKKSRQYQYACFSLLCWQAEFRCAGV